MYTSRRSPHIVKIALLAVVFTLGFAAYDFFFIQHVSAVDAPVPPSGLTDAQTAVMDKIDSIRLDSTIFTDPIFSSLEDYSVTIGTESPGNTNPFAPFTGASQIKAPVKTVSTKSATH